MNLPQALILTFLGAAYHAYGYVQLRNAQKQAVEFLQPRRAVALLSHAGVSLARRRTSLDTRPALKENRGCKLVPHLELGCCNQVPLAKVGDELCSLESNALRSACNPRLPLSAQK